MEKYSYSRYWLAGVLAGTPPELLGAMILVVLVRPDLLVAVFLNVVTGFFYVLNVIVGEIITKLLGAIFLVYVWSRLSPQHRQAVKTFLERILPNKVSQHLGITTKEEP